VTEKTIHRLPRRTDGADLQRFPQGAVLSPGNASEAVALNPTALALWELCDGHTTVEEMVAAICTLFAIDSARARADIETALAQMRAVGVIR